MIRLVVSCAAFAVAISLVGQSNGLIRKVRESRVLQWFGAAPFSIYLWQQPFHLMVIQRDIDPVTGIAGTLAVGITAFHSVEGPARAWLNRN